MKTWSSTQGIITLSSGEAEYYGLVKGTSIRLGMRNLLKDLGVELGLQVYTDASAVVGIANRRGSGKVRHIEVHQLWVQEKVTNGEIKVNKVNGDKNPADALTKRVDQSKVKGHLNWVNLRVASGRHPEAPRLTEDAG